MPFCDSNGENCVAPNLSGESTGIDGDGWKIGGNRFSEEAFCKGIPATSNICGSDNQVLSDHAVRNEAGDLLSINLPDGVKSVDGTLITPNNIAITQPPSPLGGVQGGTGSFLGIPYEPGSFLDKLVESFGGTHDALNSLHYYNSVGNNAFDGEFWNAVDVLLAAPMGAATLCSQIPSLCTSLQDAWRISKQPTQSTAPISGAGIDNRQEQSGEPLPPVSSSSTGAATP